jgi:CheY-like chemotaxis protein
MARVLVIDDEPDVRWLLRLSLERIGHEVLLAEDGLRGVAMAQRQHPDAIVLDLMMPVMDG